jgi:ribosomal protein L44E
VNCARCQAGLPPGRQHRYCRSCAGEHTRELRRRDVEAHARDLEQSAVPRSGPVSWSWVTATGELAPSLQHVIAGPRTVCGALPRPAEGMGCVQFRYGVLAVGRLCPECYQHNAKAVEAYRAFGIEGLRGKRYQGVDKIDIRRGAA